MSKSSKKHGNSSKHIEKSAKNVSKKNDKVNKIPTKYIDSSKFRINSSRIFFTYKTHIDYKNFIKKINKKYPVVKWIACHEKADDDNPYKHSHLAIEFSKKIDVKNSRAFDYNDIHPHLGAIRSMAASIQYCLKEDNWEANFNVPEELEKIRKNARSSKERGSISDLCERIASHNTAFEAIKAEATSLKEVLAIQTIFNAKNIDISPRLVERYQNSTLNDWQEELYNKIKHQPNPEHDRKVYWVFDKKGNNGKSFFCTWVQIHRPSETIVLNNTGSVRDISDVIRNTMASNGKDPSIILIDLPRTFEDRDSIYTTLESIKNGRLTCTKYSGKTLLFWPPHVIVFANWPPKLKAVSLDKWHIYNIHNKIMNKLDTKNLLKNGHEYDNDSSEDIIPKNRRKVIIDFDNEKEIDFIDSDPEFSSSSENEGTSSDK